MRQGKANVGDMALGQVQRPKVPTPCDDLAELIVRHGDDASEAQTDQVRCPNGGISHQLGIYNLNTAQMDATSENFTDHIVGATAQAQGPHTVATERAPVADPSVDVLRNDIQPSHFEPV
mmetsp:Transcript_25808/g.67649  ORF Transcript_25808/g.67649 Transcript_25808/m.67649 type:complete len:120 (+) Transcript_25808:595-954(+)